MRPAIPRCQGVGGVHPAASQGESSHRCASRGDVAPRPVASQIGAVIPDPHASLRDRVLRNVLHGPGESEPELRAGAADGSGLPADLSALVDKIHRHAYKVSDDDIARVRARYGDDQMFEIIVSAALGASRRRLLAGLEALEQA